MKKAILISLTAVVLMGVTALQVQAATTIAHWRLEEGSGTTVSDLAGNLPATATSSTMWSAGGTSPNGGSGSMQGDGSNYVITNSNLSGASDWSVWGGSNTIEFSLFYLGNASMPTAGNMLMGAFNAASSQGFYVSETAFGANHIGQFMRNNGGTSWHDINLVQMEADGLIQPNEWINVAMVSDSAGFKAYVNQQLLTAAHASSVNAMGPGISIAEKMVFLSRVSGGAVSGTTTLRMDEVRISSGVVAFEDLLQFPEPGTLTLVAIGGLMILRRRR